MLARLFGKPSAMSQPPTVGNEDRGDMCPLILRGNHQRIPSDFGNYTLSVDGVNNKCKNISTNEQILVKSTILYIRTDTGYEQVGLFVRAEEGNEHYDAMQDTIEYKYKYVFSKNVGKDKPEEVEYTYDELISKKLYMYQPSKQNGGGKKKRTRTRRPKKSNRRRTNRK